MLWPVVLAVVGALLVVYAALIVVLCWAWRRDPQAVSVGAAARLLPDVLRLVRRLAADRALPSMVRLQLVVLLAYLVSPIDVIPDFIPVLGYADDVLLVALVLRSVTRGAGIAAVRRHWPGTPAGLQVVERFAGLSAAS